MERAPLRVFVFCFLLLEEALGSKYTRNHSKICGKCISMHGFQIHFHRSILCFYFPINFLKGFILFERQHYTERKKQIKHFHSLSCSPKRPSSWDWTKARHVEFHLSLLHDWQGAAHLTLGHYLPWGINKDVGWNWNSWSETQSSSHIDAEITSRGLMCPTATLASPWTFAVFLLRTGIPETKISTRPLSWPSVSRK